MYTILAWFKKKASSLRMALQYLLTTCYWYKYITCLLLSPGIQFQMKKSRCKLSDQKSELTPWIFVYPISISNDELSCFTLQVRVCNSSAQNSVTLINTKMNVICIKPVFHAHNVKFSSHIDAKFVNSCMKPMQCCHTTYCFKLNFFFLFYGSKRCCWQESSLFLTLLLYVL